MKYIKFLIIFFLIIIAIITALLFSTLNSDGNINNNFNNNSDNKIIIQGPNNIVIQNQYYEPIEDNEYNVELEYDQKLSYVKNRSDYFAISSLYEKYVNKIANKDTAWLKNTLSPNYIKTYNITDENIFSKLIIPANKSSYKITITDMLTTQIDTTKYIYIVKGNCRVEGSDTIVSMQAMFEVDRTNKIYNIYPQQYMQDKGIDKLTEGYVLTNYNKEEIINKQDNTFNYVIKTDSDMAVEYFNNYSELLKYYPEEAYAKLNSEYSQKRFENEEEFKEYLKENSEVLLNMEIDKYKVYSTQNYTDYMCTDKYENLYIFRQQNGIMRYSVFLDNYTVMTDSYLKEYNQLDKFDKAKYNLNKFINMVNTKDYTAIYNVLDKNFLNKNFESEEMLAQFIKNNMYALNTIEINDADNETYEYYIFECAIINRNNSAERKKMTIIMNQSEGTEFTISFSFNK